MKIKIKVHKVQECKNNIVRLNQGGTDALKRLMRDTGCSASYLVSEILRQVEESGALEWEDCNDD